MYNLLLACTFFSLQFIFQKLFEKNSKGDVIASFWYQAMCSAVGIIFLLAKSGFTENLNYVVIIYVLLYSACGIACNVASISAMRLGTVAALGTYSLVGGMLIPFVYGVLFLNEKASIYQWIGMVILCVSLYPSLKLEKGEENEGKNSKKKRILHALFCLIAFVTNGMVVVFSKMHQISPYAVDENSFLILSSIIRIAVSVGALLFFAVKATAKGEKGGFYKAFVDIGNKKMTALLYFALFAFTALYSVLNTLGSVFSFRCMTEMDASLQFPLLSGIVIIFTAIFGRIFFKEKFSKSSIIGLVLSAVGIVFFIF